MPDHSLVHIIDDDPDILMALAFLLTTAGLSVRTYESAEAFLKDRVASEGECVVTDIRMPGMSGTDLQRQLLKENDDIPVIVMTAHGDVALAVEAMKAGAVDFIEKPFDQELLLTSVRTSLARGKDRQVRAQRSAEVRKRLELLTERERQVLDGLVAGKSNKVVAYDLGLSVRTIEGHRATVMAKMQTRNLPALIRMMFANPVEE